MASSVGAGVADGGGAEVAEVVSAAAAAGNTRTGKRRVKYEKTVVKHVVGLGHTTERTKTTPPPPDLQPRPLAILPPRLKQMLAMAHRVSVPTR